jgi:CRP-like cAMP-binding protein
VLPGKEHGKRMHIAVREVLRHRLHRHTDARACLEHRQSVGKVLRILSRESRRAGRFAGTQRTVTRDASRDRRNLRRCGSNRSNGIVLREAHTRECA